MRSDLLLELVDVPPSNSTLELVMVRGMIVYWSRRNAQMADGVAETTETRASARLKICGDRHERETFDCFEVTNLNYVAWRVVGCNPQLTLFIST